MSTRQFLAVIIQLYEIMQYQIMHNNDLSEPFPIANGV